LDAIFPSPDIGLRAKPALRTSPHQPAAHAARLAEDNGELLVWVAYTTLPVRVYRDAGAKLELVKDFYEAGPQRALDLQHMEVDQKTGDVYIADAQGYCFRVTDWKDPKFVLCMQDAKTPLRASSIAIDARSRHLYTHYHWGTPVYRWAMDGDFFTLAPAGVLQKNRVLWRFNRPLTGLGSPCVCRSPARGYSPASASAA